MVLKINHDKHFARALNRYLGISTPALPSAENLFAGGVGCRWCETTNRLIVVLPGDATEDLDLLEGQFMRHGLNTLRLPAGNGAGIELSGYLSEEGLRLQ